MGTKRILIAAKDRRWRVRVATFLHAEGFAVTEVSDFDVALQVALKNEFDLALFDYDIFFGDPFTHLFEWHKTHEHISVLLMAPASWSTTPTRPGFSVSAGEEQASIIESKHHRIFSWARSASLLGAWADG